MITASDGLTRVRCFGLDMLTLVSGGVLACQGLFGGVGWGGGVGGLGGMITFLFINVPACAFLTRGSFVCALLE